ncbi:MAG: ABC transporter permease [Promethearchaeota archaeon]
MSLLLYTFRRLLALIPILFGVLLLTFILARAMPGNPYLFKLGEHMTGSQKAWYEQQRVLLGLDRSPIEQFFIWLGNLFRGDWGKSITISNNTDVWELIGQKFPKTIELTILSMVFATILGIRAGIISATNRNKTKDTVIRFFALIGVAIPVFWLGLILQYIFAIEFQKMGWPYLPGTLYFDVGIQVGGDHPTVTAITGLPMMDFLLHGRFDLWWDTLKHLILPVFCLSFISLAGITRQTRSSMLEVLELDYIRTARAKGCKEHTVIYKHAWKNAMIPTITVIGLNFAGLLGGAVLTETTFNLQGMGQLAISAINNADYNVIMATVFLMTIIFVMGNLITDILYGIVDPRIRY